LGWGEALAGAVISGAVATAAALNLGDCQLAIQDSAGNIFGYHKGNRWRLTPIWFVDEADVAN
jgi:hypothetical protein